MKSFHDLCLMYSPNPKFGGDKVTLHTYAGVYETYLAPIRKSCRAMLELGTCNGFGVQIWKRYFRNAHIYSMDIEPNYVFYDYMDDRVHLHTGDVTDANDIAKLDGLQFDVVVDDASHKIADQLKSHELLWPQVAPNGLYFIEDIQDLDTEREALEALPGFLTIADMRSVKGRYDDVIAIYRKE